MTNYKLLLSYDGTRYRGWQRQGNVEDTIQAKLEQVLCKILGQPVECSASGRTDAGVHAHGQVVSFRAETIMQPIQILTQLRRYLPGDIGALELTVAPPRFHARLSAVGKTYRYRVRNTARPDVFSRRYVTQCAEPLDLQAMQRGAALFCGTHDFASFCGNPRMKKSTVRTITDFSVERQGEEIVLSVTGDGFLMNMVRILVGTLLEIGRHQYEPEKIPEILAAKNRTAAGETAPARGLCLWEVYY